MKPIMIVLLSAIVATCNWPEALDLVLSHALDRNKSYRDEAAAVLALARAQGDEAMMNTLARAGQALLIEHLSARSTGAAARPIC